MSANKGNSHTLIVWLSLLTTCYPVMSLAQSRKPFYSREISATVDNDIIFFQDYYYTAGQDFNYRRLLNQTSKLHRLFNSKKATDSSKVIVQYRYGFKIFTSYDIDQTDVNNMDRPYAGWNYGSIAFSNFPSFNISNYYQLELGVVGPASGMEQFQNWVHSITGYDVPKGWNSQIQNEVVINAGYSRTYNWRILEDIDVVSQSALQAGTGNNAVSQEFILRLMQFNDIGNSVFTNSRLSWDSRQLGKSRRQEFFLFVGTGIHYVFSNIFIEGSLFSNNQSPFTVQREPWVLQTRYGVMFSKHDISWSITFFHLSKEVQEGVSHDYASLALAVRF